MPPKFPEIPSEIAAIFAANPAAADAHKARTEQLLDGLVGMRNAPRLKARARFAARNHKRIAKGLKPAKAVAGKCGFDHRAADAHNRQFATYAAAVQAAREAAQ